MPTYEYECTKCGEQFEYFQSIKDAPKNVCEKCGGELVKLLSAGTGLIFKGSGFYITDYKSKPNDGGSAESGKSDGGKSETKTAAAESKPSAKPAAAASASTGADKGK